ncbi:MAG: DNA-binding response regulator [Bacteroidetes bacterium]|nr:MAG: DNA-binding response regulator [Bacteroidota bacterium]
MINLLLVEDDTDLRKVLAEYLELSGFHLTTASHGQQGLDLFRKQHIDLCILDVMMPVMDGLSLAVEIRRLDPDMPVVFLTAKNQKEDRLKGLKIGADDYITKPFEAEELVLRIQNILKRSGSQKVPARQLGRLTIRFDELCIESPDEKHHMTPREACLLSYMIKHANKLMKREEILEELWGQNDYFMGRSMDVFISRLRKYLKSEPSVSLETKRGVGFILRIDTHTPV